ncbi:MAG: hypothetical protein U1F43_21850 [Myxococcota bacterium]
MMVALAGGAACDEAIPFPWEVRGSPDASSTTTTDGDTSTPVDDIPIVTGPCAIADQVFTPYCVECHQGTKQYPDLRAGALGSLANAGALAYPGQVLVVPGSSATSLLFTKLHPSSGKGALMPPDGQLDAALLDQVAAWIDDGAPACDGVVVIPPTDPPIPEPGGTITFSAPPSGFQTTHPSWAEQGTCTAGQWWKYSGDTESSSMHPGRACIDCHSRSGEGPSYSYAGTVYADVADTADCRGVSGVTVEILDDGGNRLGSAATTNAAGNFYWGRTSNPFKAGYRARLSYQGRTREMTLPVSTSGDCNTCHASTGTNGAPGRMVAP